MRSVPFSLWITTIPARITFAALGYAAIICLLTGCEFTGRVLVANMNAHGEGVSHNSVTLHESGCYGHCENAYSDGVSNHSAQSPTRQISRQMGQNSSSISSASWMQCNTGARESGFSGSLNSRKEVRLISISTAVEQSTGKFSSSYGTQPPIILVAAHGLIRLHHRKSSARGNTRSSIQQSWNRKQFLILLPIRVDSGAGAIARRQSPQRSAPIGRTFGIMPSMSISGLSTLSQQVMIFGSAHLSNLSMFTHVHLCANQLRSKLQHQLIC